VALGGGDLDAAAEPDDLDGPLGSEPHRITAAGCWRPARPSCRSTWRPFP